MWFGASFARSPAKHQAGREMTDFAWPVGLLAAYTLRLAWLAAAAPRGFIVWLRSR